MVLTRTGSARSTLSMMQRKATRYQKYLNLASVFLIVTSTIIIFMSVVLLEFYYLKTLHFWSVYFYVAPVLMICMGVYKFVVSFYGFSISNTENRGLLTVFAVLMVVGFLAQLGSIFTAIEVRTAIVLSDYGGVNYIETLQKYGEDSSVTADWDKLQTEQRCCGGLNELSGYEDYRNTPIGANNSVPDSCCFHVTERCGQGIFQRPKDSIRNSIWTTGCITALKYRLENEVARIMVVYAGVSVLIALVELIAVVLTCAYIAQITRRRLREEMVWNSVHNAADDMDHREAAKALNPSVEHETVC